jgi:hypothetical protein
MTIIQHSFNSNVNDTQSCDALVVSQQHRDWRHTTCSWFWAQSLWL